MKCPSLWHAWSWRKRWRRLDFDGSGGQRLKCPFKTVNAGKSWLDKWRLWRGGQKIKGWEIGSGKSRGGNRVRNWERERECWWVGVGRSQVHLEIPWQNRTTHSLLSLRHSVCLQKERQGLWETLREKGTCWGANLHSRASGQLSFQSVLPSLHQIPFFLCTSHCFPADKAHFLLRCGLSS